MTSGRWCISQPLDRLQRHARARPTAPSSRARPRRHWRSWSRAPGAGLAVERRRPRGRRRRARRRRVTPITPPPRTRTFMREPRVSGRGAGGGHRRRPSPGGDRCVIRVRHHWAVRAILHAPIQGAPDGPCHGSIDAPRPRLRRRRVSLVPPFIAPALFDDADAALARVREIYDASVDHLRDALQSFVNGAAPARPRARLLSVRARPHRHRRARRLAPAATASSPARAPTRRR